MKKNTLCFYGIYCLFKNYNITSFFLACLDFSCYTLQCASVPDPVSPLTRSLTGNLHFSPTIFSSPSGTLEFKSSQSLFPQRSIAKQDPLKWRERAQAAASLLYHSRSSLAHTSLSQPFYCSTSTVRNSLLAVVKNETVMCLSSLYFRQKSLCGVSVALMWQPYFSCLSKKVYDTVSPALKCMLM